MMDVYVLMSNGKIWNIFQTIEDVSRWITHWKERDTVIVGALDRVAQNQWVAWWQLGDVPDTGAFLIVEKWTVVGSSADDQGAD